MLPEFTSGEFRDRLARIIGRENFLDFSQEEIEKLDDLLGDIQADAENAGRETACHEMENAAYNA